MKIIVLVFFHLALLGLIFFGHTFGETTFGGGVSGEGLRDGFRELEALTTPQLESGGGALFGDQPLQEQQQEQIEISSPREAPNPPRNNPQGFQKEGYNPEWYILATHLRSFKYVPSKRDPFISSKVLSPFVTQTEEDISSLSLNSTEQTLIKKASSKIREFLKEKIQIGLVSYGVGGKNYIIANDSQIAGEGEKIKVDISDMDPNLLEALGEKALELLSKIEKDEKSGKQNLAIKLRKVTGRTVIFEDPLTKEGEIEKEFTKKIEAVVETY